MGTGGLVFLMIESTISAVIGAKVSPIWPCPKAYTISFPLLDSEITGLLSGIEGRKPSQVLLGYPSFGKKIAAPFSK